MGKREKARLVVTEPAVFAEGVGIPETGGQVTVSLVKADVQTREVLFTSPPT